MKKVELLSPVGDFECLKAAIQNGADAIYLGVSDFNARVFTNNFTIQDLEKAIYYTHIRNSKIYLTLNTLITNEELKEVMKIANKAYELGIDAVIVQDLGLAKLLMKSFPDLPIHASTQMTATNLNGALELKKLGFQRVVLARELSLTDIRYICENSGIDIECFVHGALCISYSGQCLFSSLIGGRSGNRGKCAQACRLPYELMKNHKRIDKGYLLSPRDLCGLEFLPDLIEAGVHSLKIEGRMKSPEYVATVTRVYRNYIDMILRQQEFKIQDKDKKDLLQVFNRGGFSSGHFTTPANRSLISKEKPNNMGIYIGNVSYYDAKKGHITINLNDNLDLGDTITFEKEPAKYTISELMIKEKNIVSAYAEQMVTIGRMKGNIHSGDKIYKIASKKLTQLAKATYSEKEQKKILLFCHICIKKEKPITISVKPYKEFQNYKDIEIFIKSDIIPICAINSPITQERIISQLKKTKNTPFEFDKIIVELDNNLYLPNISVLNELRRTVLARLEECMIEKYKKISNYQLIKKVKHTKEIKNITKKEISVLLNELHTDYNYSNLEKIDNIYIPFKYFINSKYEKILIEFSHFTNLYIYLPTIIRNNFKNLFINTIEHTLETHKIKGFVISNIGTIELLKEFANTYDFIGNYTLNIFNQASIDNFTKLGLKKITLSPELNKENYIELSKSNTSNSECIVYGNLPLMTSRYCLLGESNKCYPECEAFCRKDDKYFLKDRLGLLFRVIPDDIQTITTIYNSKTTSISHNDIPCSSVRVDILDETIEQINDILTKVKNGERIEGQNYTNGNLYRQI